MVHNTGCASKIAPADLEAVLSRLPAVNDPAVISGLPAADDAGIYKLSGDGLCLVQTVDVMTPCVDDPHAFGTICAVNCLSDIYAMGGRPLTALSILAFPAETHDGEIMYQMMKGAMEVFAQAGVALIGGHSIKDEEIKLGFAITGTINESRLARHDTARGGDILVLTKPLGSGVLGFCRQIGRDGADFAAMQAAMMTLNKDAADAMTAVGVSACTDVTGFGLFGHLASMLRHSRVSAQVFADALPAFGGVADALRDGVISGGIERNREFVGDDLLVTEGVEDWSVNLGFDPQTSGGLLICVPEGRHKELLDALGARKTPAWTIGRVVGGTGVPPVSSRVAGAPRSPGGVATSEGQIILTKDAGPLDPSAAHPWQESTNPDAVKDPNISIAGQTPLPQKGPTMNDSQLGAQPSPCCAGNASPQAAGATTADQSLQAFGAMMKSISAAGKLDAKTKELLIYALAVAGRCGPCVGAHVKAALKMGITQEELDEAAWCAIAMGGAPVRMFYLEAMQQAKEAAKAAGKCC
jgi:selenide,water dikinase